jgi:A/G-specific adenine glycosylase
LGDRGTITNGTTSRASRNVLPKSRVSRGSMRPLPGPGDIRWFQARLTKWFEAHGREFPWRHSSAGVFHRVLAEILLQRTTAPAVARFLPGFITRFRTWGEIARLSESRLGEHLRPLGLWRRRARSLRLLAEAMVARSGRYPRNEGELQALPGVGQYVANAILLFRYGKERPLLDSGMARVLERFFGPRQLVDIRYDPYLQELAHRVVRCGTPMTLNWAILDFAALVCKSKLPQCRSCPLAVRCQFALKARRASRKRNEAAQVGPAI